MVKTIDARVLFGIFMLGAMLLAAVPEDPGVDSSDAGQLVWDTSEVEPEDDLFRTSDRCLACHKGVVTSDGLDVSIGYDWRASMMANSARDPYWQAAVRREVLDYPDASNEIEDNCSSCHMPMARTSALMSGRTGSVFANLPVSESIEGEAALAVDGVSCAACHQISQDGLGTEASFTGGYRIAYETPPEGRTVYGPFEPDSGGVGIMHSATGFRPTEGTHTQSSEFCATCHTLFSHSIRSGAAEGPEFPEQAPYLEWKASSFATDGESCQDCHMPEVGEDVPVTGVLGHARPDVSRHVFRGGNFFMLRMLNRYRDELGVVALPQELALAADRTERHLQQKTVALSLRSGELVGGTLEAIVEINNLAGHKFPTAYPSRRAWLHTTIVDRDGRMVFESGAFSPDGSIVGSDHDADGTRYEPHYAEISNPDQVQIYEAVMADEDGRVTTGLMSAERWVKDNRILPAGFDPTTSDPRVAVVGAATSDADFASGKDHIRYSIRVDPGTAPFTLNVELWFQPIGYRWAQNLAEYDAFETDRFVRYFETMASSSAIVIAESSVVIQ